MFHIRGVINKINRLHKRSLSVVCNENISSFEDLLKRDISFNIHQRNIQSLPTELLKVKGNLSNNIMCNLSCNESIISLTIEFIVSTERFSNSLV